MNKTSFYCKQLGHFFWNCPCFNLLQCLDRAGFGSLHVLHSAPDLYSMPSALYRETNASTLLGVILPASAVQLR